MVTSALAEGDSLCSFCDEMPIGTPDDVPVEGHPECTR
jgi:hypothetical protein